MKRDIKVTIGLCVKNVEETVKEALQSILNQDYPHELLELIIVDGCSKDNTLSIIQKELSKANIKCKIFRENVGLGYARQIVVDNASGKYIVWVDGDMILPRDHTSKQVEFMENHPKVAIGKARYGLVNENSLPAILENIEFVASYIKSEKTKSKVFGTSGCIYRVDAVRQVGGFDKNIKKAGEDADIEYRIKAVGWSTYITPSIFYEKFRKTWKSLWDEYFSHGYGMHYVLHKNTGVVVYYKIFPPIGLFENIKRSYVAYKLTTYKAAFFLPLHWIFKRIAWFFGFIKAHLEGYGHQISKV